MTVLGDFIGTDGTEMNYKAMDSACDTCGDESDYWADEESEITGGAM